MSDIKYQIGDPIWCKMKGFCTWPSRIAAPHESALKNTAADKLKTPKNFYLVYFFGSHNFAWMTEDTIQPYEEYKEEGIKKGKKTAQFTRGLKEIDEYISNGGKATLSEPPPTKGSAKLPTGGFVPSAAGDSVSNDASNLDGKCQAKETKPTGDLPSIDEEIAAIRTKKPAPSPVSSRKLKNSHDSYNDSPTHDASAPSSVQRDYSRTPFKSRKSAKSEESSTELTSPTKRLKSTEDNYGGSSLPSPTISTTKSPANKLASRNVLTKNSLYSDIVDTPQISASSVTSKTKSVRPSNLKFGFLGLGFMGQRLVKHLINTGHNVTIWNRTHDKLSDFAQTGVTPAQTPSDVVSSSDVIFSCVSNPNASKEVVFTTFGVLHSMGPDKSYVELSSIDPETSTDISEAIISRGGRYLEAPILCGGKQAAEAAELIIIAAGDRAVYEDCNSCFQAMAKRSIYLGSKCGDALKMHLAMSALYGSIIGALSECTSLIDRNDLPMAEFREVLKLSTMNCPLIEKAVDKMIGGNREGNMPLHHLQKDLRMALAISEESRQACPITAVVNEVLKHAGRVLNYEDDVCSIYFNRI